MLGWRRLCEEYNKCVVDRATYATRSENMRRRLAKVPELLEALKGASSDPARVSALSAAYDSIVPDDKRIGLETTFSVIARRPNDSSFAPAPQGATLPTETRVAFAIRVNKPAFVYIYQQTPTGKINVIFPDKRIGVANPIPASELRIPPGQQNYKVNDRDIGTEKVFVAASLTPLPKLEAAMVAGEADGPKQPLLAQLATMKADGSCKTRALELDEGPAPAASPCPRPRGIELDTGSGSAPTASVHAKTEAGDGTIVQVFKFEHTR